MDFLRCCWESHLACRLLLKNRCHQGLSLITRAEQDIWNCTLWVKDSWYGPCYELTATLTAKVSSSPRAPLCSVPPSQYHPGAEVTAPKRAHQDKVSVLVKCEPLSLFNLTLFQVYQVVVGWFWGGAVGFIPEEPLWSCRQKLEEVRASQKTSAAFFPFFFFQASMHSFGVNSPSSLYFQVPQAFNQRTTQPSKTNPRLLYFEERMVLYSKHLQPKGKKSLNFDCYGKE